MSELKALAIVIDDDIHLGEAFRQALEISGFRAKHIDDSTKAIKILIAEEPALVLLDMQMPLLNGEEVLRLIRETEQTKAIKVIVASANHSTLNDYIMANADLVLQKPVSLAQIMAFSKRLLSAKT